MEKETLSSGRIVIHEKERVNGWSCPPHPFQVVAWFFVVAIPLVYYGTIVSHLPDKWIPAGCIVSFSTYVVFLHSFVELRSTFKNRVTDHL